MSGGLGDRELLVVSLFTPAAGRREELLEVLSGDLDVVLGHRPGFLGGGLYGERDGSRLMNLGRWSSRTALLDVLRDERARRAMDRQRSLAESTEVIGLELIRATGVRPGRGRP